jgi:hypothetical protein
VRALRTYRRRHGRNWAAKKVLLSAMVVGGLSFFTLANTFAILSSQESNSASFASGTLTFSNTVNSGTACFSYGLTGASNSNASCDALFTSSTLMYPGTPVYANVAIANTGSVRASSLAFYMPSCTAVASPSAPSPGGGNPCAANGAQMFIAETSSSYSLVGSKCVFPVASTSPCTGPFLTSTLNFATTKFDASHVMALGVAGAQSLAAGATRYFVIGLQLPTTASNTLQGEEALFKITWLLTS